MTNPGCGHPPTAAVLLDLDRPFADLQSPTDDDIAWAQVRGLVDPSLAASGPATGWPPSAARAHGRHRGAAGLSALARRVGG